MKKKHKSILILFLILFFLRPLYLINHNFIEKRDSIKRYLLSLGIAIGKSYKNYDEYIFYKNILCQIVFDLNFNRLSKIYIYKVDSKDNIYNKQICIPLQKYRKIISIFNNLHALGKYIKDDPISIVIRRGWIQRTEIYENALISKIEKNTGNTNSLEGTCISRFTIHYKLSLSGIIEAKFIEDNSDIIAWLIPVYILKISGKTIEVTEGIYKKYSIGNELNLKVIRIGNNRYSLREIIETKHVRKKKILRRKK
jgi:hypothetical protein